MAAGKFAEACDAFEASQRADPAISTLLNEANCREKNSQLATAWGLFLEAERQTRAATDPAVEPMHKSAAAHAEKLEPRLSSLTIKLRDELRISGLEITVDGRRVDTGALNKPLPIDGGPHAISARAPGRKTWTANASVEVEHDSKTVDIPKLEADTPQAAPIAPAVETSRSRLPSVVIGGCSLALLGGALGVDLWANSKYDAAKAETTDQVRRNSLYAAANNRRYVAEGLALAGVATAGVAVWLYFRDRDDERPGQVARGKQLVVSPTGIAIIGTF